MNLAPQKINLSDGNIIARRNDFDQFPHTVLLLNGLHQTRGIWEIMEDRLRRYNYGVCSLNLSNVYTKHRFATLENQSHWLHEKLDRLFTKYDLDHIHIIGASTGGLVARHMIQYFDKGQRVLSLCTLATPHHSSSMGLLNTFIRGTGLKRLKLPNFPTSNFFHPNQTHPFPNEVPITSIFGAKDWLAPWWVSVLRLDGHPDITNIHLRNVRSLDLSSDSQSFEAVKKHLDRATEKVSEPLSASGT